MNNKSPNWGGKRPGAGAPTKIFKIREGERIWIADVLYTVTDVAPGVCTLIGPNGEEIILANVLE